VYFQDWYYLVIESKLLDDAWPTHTFIVNISILFVYKCYQLTDNLFHLIKNRVHHLDN